MSTKEILVKTIRDWVKIDNELRALKKEEVIRKNDKKDLTNTLMEIMKSNEIDCVDIKDGQLCYTQTNIKKPITKKNLMNILSKYYKGDMDKANNLTEYISNNREEISKESITRKIKK
jgi:DNA mismatch repair ATPase MutS